MCLVARVAFLPMSEVDRAVADRAGEMIHEPALAMRTGMFTGRLAQTVHAYPTWSLAVQQAAAQFFGEHGGRRAIRVDHTRT